MASIITVADLAVWAQEEIDDEDVYAQAIVEAASLVVRTRAKQPTWGDIGVVVPAMAIFITKMLANRAWTNGVVGVQSDSIGPLSQRLVEDFARGMELTPQEMADLDDLAPAGTSTGKGFWIQPLTRGPMEAVTAFRYDSSGSDWAIPMIDSEDGYAFAPEELV
jgi:hypothetical protein